MFEEQFDVMIEDNEIMAENNAFITKIGNIINEMKAARAIATGDDSYQPLKPRRKGSVSFESIEWKTEYVSLLEKLEDISDIIDGDINLAKKRFRDLEVSKFETFDAYINTVDLSLLNSKKGNNERPKMLRARRKNNNVCPTCGGKLSIQESVLTCSTCGYVAAGKGSTPNTRSSTDNNKHTMKQLDAVIGKKKPPANISKIVNHIATWLTDMHFIYDWLVNNRKLDSWMEKFFMLSHQHIDESFFSTVFERIPENKWRYDVFKLFTDEMYLLLENAKKMSKIRSSNMNMLPNDKIIEIFLAYFSDGDGEVPSVNDVYVYTEEDEDGTEVETTYEVGLYINQLRLVYDTPKNSVKDQLEQLYGCSLTMPGLMFNFTDVYEQSANVPKKYNYQQEYMYIIHCSFNVPFANICQQDITNITDLILKFNAYYKNEMYKVKNKQCNAPLFCCTLSCIIQDLPYFNKYDYVEECIPLKDKNTLANIKSNWFKFTCDHEELIKPYLTYNGNEIVKPDDNSNSDKDAVSTISGRSMNIIDDVLDNIGQHDSDEDNGFDGVNPSPDDDNDNNPFTFELHRSQNSDDEDGFDINDDYIPF